MLFSFMDYLLAQADSTQVPSKINNKILIEGERKREMETHALASQTPVFNVAHGCQCALLPAPLRPRHCLNCSTSLSCRPDQTFLPHLKTNQTFPFRDSRAQNESISVSPYLACTNIKHHKNQIRHHKNFLKTSYVVSLCSSKQHG